MSSSLLKSKPLLVWWCPSRCNALASVLCPRLVSIIKGLAQTGSLTLVSTASPWGSKVWLDGKYVGKLANLHQRQMSGTTLKLYHMTSDLLVASQWARISSTTTSASINIIPGKTFHKLLSTMHQLMFLSHKNIFKFPTNACIMKISQCILC